MMKRLRPRPSASSYKKTKTLARMSRIVMTGNVREGMLSLKGIMFRRCLFVFAIVFACGVYANAAPADPKQIYDRATDALYNLDFNIAQRDYETLTHDYPDNPDY